MAKINYYELNDLMFRTKKRKVELIGMETGVCIDVPDKKFLSPKHREGDFRVKLTTAAKLLDWLNDGTACLYTSKEGDTSYCEFLIKEDRYHCLYINGKIFVQEPDINGRVHKLFCFLMLFLQKNTALRERLEKWNIANKMDVFAFCDEFWYGRVAKTLAVHENAVKMQGIVKDDFALGKFVCKYGNLITEYDDAKETFIEPEASDPDPFFEDMEPSPAHIPVHEEEKENKSSLFKDIKKGSYLLEYEWDKEQKSAVVPLSFLDGYVPDDNFFSLFNKLKRRLQIALERIQEKGDETASKRDCINLFLVGRPGTGKTYMLYALAAAFGLPLRSVPMGKNTEEDTFTGMTQVIDGALQNVTTPFAMNGKKGGITIVEEINLADPDVVMGAIGQFVEFPFTLMENGCHPVKRHALNIVCGTMNIGTAGSKEVSEALSSRFSSTYILEDPSKTDFIKRLTIEGFDKKLSTWVYDKYSMILDLLKSPDYNCEEYALNVTFRSCLGALQAIEDGDTPKQAIYHTMIGKLAEKDMDVAEQIWQIIEAQPDF